MTVTVPAPAADVVALRQQGADARHARNWQAMISLGDTMERLGAYADAWPLLADAPLLRQPGVYREWCGEPLAGRTLLVRKRIRHVGAELRMARFIGSATRSGAEVKVLGDERLSPLVVRTFGVVGAQSTFDFEASFERLAQFFGSSSAMIAREWTPLRADVARRSTFRDMYAGSGQPIVGIAWFSTNSRKAVPEATDWATLLSAHPARWCSLQYREQEAGLGHLQQLAGCSIMPDVGIDQMRDLDGFAAQVAAVDGVLTISNTTAHMAGALGVPCIVIVGDEDHLSWPVASDATPFYPQLRLVRRRSRAWPDVLHAAYAALESLISTRCDRLTQDS